ncbi:MAG: hypothetical protein ACREEM_02460 [Blastocatellia bacterium]
MSAVLTTQKNEVGWVVEIPSDVARSPGVAEGSVALLYGKDGNVGVEILSPPSPELLDEVHETYDELKETFAELRRRGD